MTEPNMSLDFDERLVKDMPYLTRADLCKGLNRKSIVGREDYKTLAGLMGMTTRDIQTISMSSDPADQLLSWWQPKISIATVAKLRELLLHPRMNREDLVGILDWSASTETKSVSQRVQRMPIQQDLVDRGDASSSNKAESSKSGTAKLTSYRFGHPPLLSVQIPKLGDLLVPNKSWESISLPTDVLLLTVEDDEFLACFAHLGNIFKSHANAIGWVYFGEIGHSQKKVKVAVVRSFSGSFQVGGSQNVVGDAVECLKPKVVFSVGHCGGLRREKTKLGDVVISAKLTTYDDKEIIKDQQIWCGHTVNVSRHVGYLIKSATDGWKTPLNDPEALEVKVHRNAEVLSGPKLSHSPEARARILEEFPGAVAVVSESEGLYAAAYNSEIEWAIVKGVSHYVDVDVSESETKGWETFASVMAASIVAHILTVPDVLKGWSHYQGNKGKKEAESSSRTRLHSDDKPRHEEKKETTFDDKTNVDGDSLQKLDFVVDVQGGGISFPAANAFLQFPSEAVSKPVSITWRRVSYGECPKKPKNGDVFCSSIIKIEAEAEEVIFHKPITVILSHSAFESGAYIDYQDVAVQQLKHDWEDLESERISKSKDLSNQTVSTFSDIAEYLPVVQSTIIEPCTLVAVTRIRSKEIVLQPDELYVYPKSYGKESKLEILFPVGAVQTECRLTVQLLPPNKKVNDDLIHLPVLQVSGQKEAFLKPVKVELSYCTAGVADIDDKFLPIGKRLPFCPKFGVLLQSDKAPNCDETQWKRDATIKRTRKDSLQISFSVLHFCKTFAGVKKSEDAGVQTAEHNQSPVPRIRVVCLAVLKISESLLCAVLAPNDKKLEVKEQWGSTGNLCNDPLECDKMYYFCLPESDRGHDSGHVIDLLNDNIRYYGDQVNVRYNKVNSDRNVEGEVMHFLFEKCVEDKHSGSDCFGQYPVSKQKTAEGQVAVKRCSVNTLESSQPSSAMSSAVTGRAYVIPPSSSGSNPEILEDLKTMSERCKLFEEEVKRLCSERLEIDHQSKVSKAAKLVGDASPVITLLLGIGGGLAIVLSISSLGIASAFGGAAVATAGFVVKRVNDYNNKKATSDLKKLYNIGVASVISILDEVGKELSRIFEEQLFRLKNDEDVIHMACCAVNLMFKFKPDDKFSRNTLLRNVFVGKTSSHHLETKSGQKKWKVPDVFQKPGLRKEVSFLLQSNDTIRFKYFRKPNKASDPETYGYRGKILETKTTKNTYKSVESEEQDGDCKEPECSRDGFTCSCFSVDDADNSLNSTEEVGFFEESDIDEFYSEPCPKAEQYQPFHCLVQCPNVLERFASLADNQSHSSLKEYVSRMYYSRSLPVRPVYRAHSPKIVRTLSNTDLTGSDFIRVHFPNTSLEKCILTGCTILWGVLKEANFSGSNFKETYLSHCSLVGAKAPRCDWTSAKVLYCRVDNADLTNPDGVFGNKWKGTNMDAAITSKSLSADVSSGNCQSEERQGSDVRALSSQTADVSSGDRQPEERQSEDAQSLPLKREIHMVLRIPHSVRVEICQSLNVKRPLGGDFTTLGGKLGMTDQEIKLISGKESPADEVLTWWQTQHEATVSKFRKILVEMKRGDIVRILDREYPTDPNDSSIDESPRDNRNTDGAMSSAHSDVRKRSHFEGDCSSQEKKKVRLNETDEEGSEPSTSSKVVESCSTDIPDGLQSDEIIRIAYAIPHSWKEVALLTKQFEQHEIENIRCTKIGEEETSKALTMLMRFNERNGTREQLVKTLREVKQNSLAQQVKSGYFMDSQ